MRPTSKFYEVVNGLDDKDRLVFKIRGQSLEGEDKNKTVGLQLGPRLGDGSNPIDDARKRLAEAGMSVSGMGEMMQVSTVRFGSRASKARIEQGYDIVGVKLPTDRINAHWFYIPGLLIGGARLAAAGLAHAACARGGVEAADARDPRCGGRRDRHHA